MRGSEVGIEVLHRRGQRETVAAQEHRHRVRVGGDVVAQVGEQIDRRVDQQRRGVLTHRRVGRAHRPDLIGIGDPAGSE